MKSRARAATVPASVSARGKVIGSVSFVSRIAFSDRGIPTRTRPAPAQRRAPGREAGGSGQSWRSAHDEHLSAVPLVRPSIEGANPTRRTRSAVSSVRIGRTASDRFLGDADVGDRPLPDVRARRPEEETDLRKGHRDGQRRADGRPRRLPGVGGESGRDVDRNDARGAFG